MSSTVNITYKQAEGIECSILLEPITKVNDPCRVYPCGHFFAFEEITAWTKKSNECPLRCGTIEHIKMVVWIDEPDEFAEVKPEKSSSVDSEKAQLIQNIHQQGMSLLMRYFAESKFVHTHGIDFQSRSKEISFIMHASVNKPWGLQESVTCSGSPIDDYYKRDLRGSGRAQLTLTMSPGCYRHKLEPLTY